MIAKDSETPLRIVHLIDSLSMGGAERMIVTFARYLRREEFALEVCCLQEPGPLAKEVETEGVSVTAMGQKNNYDPVVFPRLVRFLRRGRKAGAPRWRRRTMGPCCYRTPAP